ncbi:MAG: ISAzo13-like element transposase-related protein, partial [Thermoplasmatota archaeon]
SVAAIVDLIAGTTTRTGREVLCEVDRRHYEKGRVISDAQMAQLDVRPDSFHGDWNYRVHPRKSPE